MKITDIQTQKKDKNRVSIFIDGSFAFGMKLEDCLFYNLKMDGTVTCEKLDEIKNDCLKRDALNWSYRYLSYSARTNKQIQDYLIKKEVPDEIIDEVMEILIKHHYVDDKSYCLSYYDAHKKKKGVRAIQFELKRKGVSDETLQEVFSEIEPDEYNQCLALLEKKYGRKSIFDFETSKKAYDYLYRKGFQADVVGETLREFRKNFKANEEIDYFD